MRSPIAVTACANCFGVRSDGKKMAVLRVIVVVWKGTAANNVSGSVLGRVRRSLGLKQSRNPKVVNWL